MYTYKYVRLIRRYTYLSICIYMYTYLDKLMLLLVMCGYCYQNSTTNHSSGLICMGKNMNLILANHFYSNYM